MAIFRSRSISEAGLTEDFLFQLARRKISNHTSALRFGRNDNVGVTAETIWPYGGLYNWIASPTQILVSSSSTADTTDGTGLREIQIIGLDADWNPQVESIRLSGQATTQTTKTWQRILRLTGNHCGSSNTNEGVVYIHNSAVTDGVPDTATAVYGLIDTGSGQSEQCVHTIPAQFTGYLTAARFYGGKVSQGSRFQLFTRGNNGEAQPFRLRGSIDLVSNSSILNFEVPLQLAQRTDIEIRANLASGTTVCSASFDLIIIKEVDKTSTTIPAIVEN